MAQVAVGYALRMAKGHAFQAPTGTRDFYPADMLRRRYIEKMWRDTSIRHGFEEIDGPTFEHLDLYTVKSGEGIVNELFSFKRAGGEKDYALRPEFTPTLARMYAAKAGGLAKPTKWFTAGPFFRAERPQRGRLREFLQWNVDFIGEPLLAIPEAGTGYIQIPPSDSEVLTCLIDFLSILGFTSRDVRVALNHRGAIEAKLRLAAVAETSFSAWYALLDNRSKMKDDAFLRGASEITGDAARATFVVALLSKPQLQHEVDEGADPIESMIHDYMVQYPTLTREQAQDVLRINGECDFQTLALYRDLTDLGYREWVVDDPSIVRGLAYYTGMVFEVHEAGGKERAIAGGGRYDNLIELFGGPPTPAVGFGMGDVVLSLVLQDKGLMPEGAALMDKLSEPPASPRPDIFVISNDQPESMAAVRPLVAGLRRGENGGRPLHARRSYKATKNIGKLLQEASACHSRFAAILESGSEATLKNLTTGEQTQKVPLNEVGTRVCHHPRL